MERIGFGGSCHWCTEAIFQSLIGVEKVEQGWISSADEHLEFSEAVVVSYEPIAVSLETLIEVHLYTHSCTSRHSMRTKYRSAVYFTSDGQGRESAAVIGDLQIHFSDTIITQVLPLIAFKLNSNEYLNYYYDNPQKPFCKNIVHPKLKVLLAKFSSFVDRNKLQD
ncbi:peptide-methionine (S)-S-oxide reductase [Pedobacter psychrodurus]|uniref:peptide-methionine (S)-S-oxide reductase n=1 Tax=Pedobacter psychrodurus TaxID=2530456 RepID=UPI00292DF4BA|nr:peptide-methionine (S)-S-oxide reductase [Pedobacter psychrodurus]